MTSIENQVEQLTNEGLRLSQMGDFDAAIERLWEAADLDPSNMYVQALLGVNHYYNGDPAGALLPLAECLFFNPSAPAPRMCLGVVLAELGFEERGSYHIAYAAHLGHRPARARLNELGLDCCTVCGGPRAPAGTCADCAGAPPPVVPPRDGAWPWAHRPADDRRSAMFLPSHGIADAGRQYLARYVSDGDKQDLEDAIIYFELACATADPVRDRGVRLSELGVAFRRRHSRYGLATDLDHAIDCQEQALELVPDDSPTLTMILSNAGLAYSERHRLTGVHADLDRSVGFLERAIAALGPDQAGRTPALANAGLVYQRRFEVDRHSPDIDRATVLLTEAVDHTPDEDPSFPVRAGNLAACLMASYQHGHDQDGTPDLAGAAADPIGLADLADLRLVTRAIELLDRAIAATPSDSPDLPQRLANRAVAHLCHYARRRRADDVAMAIADLDRADDRLPDGHPQLPLVIAHRAEAYLTPDADTTELTRQTVHTFDTRLDSVRNAIPGDLVRAKRDLGTLAGKLGFHDLAVEFLDSAVEMLPAVSTHDMSWSDREQQLGEFNGTASQAVAAHCALGDPVAAVGAAEQGRGIQLAMELDAHTDLGDLTREIPELARAFRAVRSRLNDPSSIGTGSMPELWERYEAVLTEIRAHPGFSRFLRAPELTDVRPVDGTIVLVNSGRQRGDAILIRPDGDPVQVPLRDLSSDDVLAQARTMAWNPRGDLVTDHLAWLWDTVGGPVRDALVSHTRVPCDSVPQRIWWLPIGLLGMFPLHAAGSPGQVGALDAFVSSYTPTLRVLGHTRNRSAAVARRQLTVALASTPGLPGLPGTLAEALALHRSRPDHNLLVNELATRENVAAALPDATWIHFACHALANPEAPSTSGLMLSDGALPLSEIGRLGLTDAYLAYLSACSTGFRTFALADESLNLASAFHLAGFRHVVASLWPLDDEIGAEASRRFYQELGTAAADNGTADISAALRMAVLALREEYPDRPDLWAALIHSGS